MAIKKSMTVGQVLEAMEGTPDRWRVWLREGNWAADACSVEEYREDNVKPELIQKFCDRKMRVCDVSVVVSKSERRVYFDLHSPRVDEAAADALLNALGETS